jgi:hypothetical protein
MGLGIFHVATSAQFNNFLEMKLGRMRVEYSLTEAQLGEVREMEIAFHGRGNPFFRPSHTLEEQRAHEIAISKTMSPENAKRFLASRRQREDQGRLHSAP